MSDQEYLNFLRETKKTWQKIQTRAAGYEFSYSQKQVLILPADTDLTGATLRQLYLPGAVFNCTELQGVDLAQATLRGRFWAIESFREPTSG